MNYLFFFLFFNVYTVSLDLARGTVVRGSGVVVRCMMLGLVGLALFPWLPCNRCAGLTACRYNLKKRRAPGTGRPGRTVDFLFDRRTLARLFFVEEFPRFPGATVPLSSRISSGIVPI